MKTCKNCSKSFDQSFCNFCGQKYIDQRFTLKQSIGWIFSSIFNFEKGFLHTTKTLFQDPKKLIGDYMDGVTVRYIHPFRFIFVWATVSALIAIATHAYEEIGQISAEMNGQGVNGFNEAFGKSYGEFLKKYMSIITLMLIPFLSVFTKLFYRKRKLYFAEHLILNSFSLSATTIVGIIPVFFYFFLDHEQIKSAMYLTTVIAILVSSYVNSRFFNENIILSIIKYVFIYSFAIILLIIIGLIILLIHALLIKFAGFENVYAPFIESVKAAGEAAKAAKEAGAVQ